MGDIRQWLDQIGLPQYADLFDREQIDLAAARDLSDADLKELGLPLGPRTKLRAAIQRLQDRPVAATAPASIDPNSINISDGERRQLTVLFCDLVGFTELASRVDPEVLQKIIRAYEDACAVCITRYEGYVFQRLGDGIVAFFGYAPPPASRSCGRARANARKRSTC